MDVIKPKVQLIVPAATASKVCDIVTAVGANPIMGCTTPDEAQEVSRLVDATFLSFGTPTTEETARAVLDARIVVVDPVGVGLPGRGKIIQEWLDARARVCEANEFADYCTIIKGNASEISALCELNRIACFEKIAARSVTTMSEGSVVSLDKLELSNEPVSELTSSFIEDNFRELRGLALGSMATIVMTGSVDVIIGYPSGGFVVHSCSTSMFDAYAGAGCALGALCAVKVAESYRRCIHDPQQPFNGEIILKSLADVAVSYRQAGAVADARSEGPGSFQLNLLDDLYNISSMKNKSAVDEFKRTLDLVEKRNRNG